MYLRPCKNKLNLSKHIHHLMDDISMIWLYDRLLEQRGL